MRVFIFGKDGQLGKEFIRYFSTHKEAEQVFVFGHFQCDISDTMKVLRIFEELRPDVVINCAAYNFVDKAETDYKNAVKVNAVGVRNLAIASREVGAFFVHYSTDYVFDGKKENGLYTEEDIPNPVNEYGKSKFLGEEFLKEETENYLLFRVSWVYGDGKQNFINKLLSWSEKNPYLKVANDEVSVPTSTRTIVDITVKAIKMGIKGLYHLTNSGYASRYEWAKKIFEIKKINKFIKPVSSDIFELPAKRPKFSAMSNKKISRELGIEIERWDRELEHFLSR